MDGLTFLHTVFALWVGTVLWLLLRRYFVEAVVVALAWMVLIALWLPSVQAARPNWPARLSEARQR